MAVIQGSFQARLTGSGSASGTAAQMRQGRAIAAALQPRAGTTAIPVASEVLHAAVPGERLPDGVRLRMESAFGTSFTDVRVYVGPQASRIGAVAFTTGSSIYFAPGQYRPDTAAGRELLGHELAHVVQQRQGRVRAPLGGLAIVQDPVLEAEADRLGRRAANLPSQHRPVSAQLAATTQAVAASAPVQRSPDKEPGVVVSSRPVVNGLSNPIQAKTFINRVADYDEDEIIDDVHYIRSGSPGGHHFVADNLVALMISNIIVTLSRKDALDILAGIVPKIGRDRFVFAGIDDTEEYDRQVDQVIRNVSDQPSNRFTGANTGDAGGTIVDYPKTPTDLQRVAGYAKKFSAAMKWAYGEAGKTPGGRFKSLLDELDLHVSIYG